MNTPQVRYSSTLKLPTKGQLAKRKVRRFISTFGVYCGIAFWFIVCLSSFLVHFHILPEELHIFSTTQILALTLFIGLIWVISEQIKESNEELDRYLQDSVNEISALKNQINSLVAKLSPQLHLLECVQEYKQELDKIPPHEEVAIDHLGLDMHEAWRYIREDFISYHGIVRKLKLKYRLLMLTGDPNEMCDLADEVKRTMQEMCSASKDSLDRIKEFLRVAKDQLEGIEVEIRMYKEIPVIHGFKADKPEKVHYLSFFRWGGYKYMEYDWGEGRYHRIKAAPDNSSFKDLADIFDGYFEHLWNISQRVYPELPTFR